MDKAGDELVDAITLPADAPGPFAYCVARIAIDALLCQLGAASVFPSGNQVVRLPVSGPGLPDRMSLANQGSFDGQPSAAFGQRGGSRPEPRLFGLHAQGMFVHSRQTKVRPHGARPVRERTTTFQLARPEARAVKADRRTPPAKALQLGTPPRLPSERRLRRSGSRASELRCERSDMVEPAAHRMRRRPLSEALT